jgi:hypothetical protein
LREVVGKEGGEFVDLLEVGLAVVEGYVFMQLELGFEGEDLFISEGQFTVVFLNDLSGAAHKFIVFLLTGQLPIPINLFLEHSDQFFLMFLISLQTSNHPLILPLHHSNLIPSIDLLLEYLFQMFDLIDVESEAVLF